MAESHRHAWLCTGVLGTAAKWNARSAGQRKSSFGIAWHGKATKRIRRIALEGMAPHSNALARNGKPELHWFASHRIASLGSVMQWHGLPELDGMVAHSMARERSVVHWQNRRVVDDTGWLGRAVSRTGTAGNAMPSSEWHCTALAGSATAELQGLAEQSRAQQCRAPKRNGHI